MINLVDSTLFFHLYEFLVLAMDVQTTNIWLSTNIGLVTVEQSGNTKIMAHYCTCIKSQPLILSHFPFIKQRRIASLYQNEPLRNNKFWGLNWIPNCIFERIPIPNSGSSKVLGMSTTGEKETQKNMQFCKELLSTTFITEKRSTLTSNSAILPITVSRRVLILSLYPTIVTYRTAPTLHDNGI